MDYKEYLNSQVLVGYSKSDLERLIGLPKNFLSGFLSGKKNLGAKNKLRVLNWSMVDSKPTPLEVDNYLKKVANKKLGLVIFTEPMPTSFDAEKIDKIKHDEVGQWAEPNLINRIITDKTGKAKINEALIEYGKSQIVASENNSGLDKCSSVYPTDYNQWLREVKGGISNKEEFIEALSASNLNYRQKEMILSKII